MQVADEVKLTIYRDAWLSLNETYVWVGRTLSWGARARRSGSSPAPASRRSSAGSGIHILRLSATVSRSGTRMRPSLHPAPPSSCTAEARSSLAPSIRERLAWRR